VTMGIYLDTCSSNCFVYGNILVRGGKWGIYIQGGKNTIVENNIFVDCHVRGRLQRSGRLLVRTQMKGS